nr:PREDICTED: uncharacterized protein LOC109033098 [Bemisia tabaci]
MATGGENSDNIDPALKAANDKNLALLDQMKIMREEMNYYQAKLAERQPATTITGEKKNIKLPPFNLEKPQLWFSQVESVFTVWNISNEMMRYSLVSSQLETRVANEVEDILVSPPTDTPYSKLKAELILRLSKSETHRVRQLLTEADLGDSTPSQFLRRLKALTGTTKVDEQLMKTLWLQRLPRQAQAILQTHSRETSIDELAKIADRILKVVPAPSVCAAAATAPPEPQTSKLEKMLLALTERLDQLEMGQKKLHRDLSRSRSRSRSRSENDRRNGVCFYHHKFGDEARACRQPCSYKPKSTPTNSTGNQ